MWILHSTAITADLWTSIAHNAYLGITAHFVTRMAFCRPNYWIVSKWQQTSTLTKTSLLCWQKDSHFGASVIKYLQLYPTTDWTRQKPNLETFWKSVSSLAAWPAQWTLLSRRATSVLKWAQSWARLVMSWSTSPVAPRPSIVRELRDRCRQGTGGRAGTGEGHPYSVDVSLRNDKASAAAEGRHSQRALQQRQT